MCGLILDGLICKDFRTLSWFKAMSMIVIVWTPLSESNWSRNIVVVGRYLITTC
uniref:Uncharacterized protein n=1 Tax=Wuchereria bancrofti TaxID=6293 RepID=A0AAF5RTW0_WUCBA